MKRVFLLLFTTLFLLILFQMTSFGNEVMEEKEPSPSFPDIKMESEELEQLLPSDFKDFFHDENGKFRFPSLSFFMKIALEELKKALAKEKISFGLMITYTVISSMYTAFEGALRPSFKGPSRFLILLLGITAFSVPTIHLFTLTKEHLRSVCSFLNVTLPTVSALYLAMGAVSSAAVSSSALSLFLALTSNFTVALLFPLSKLCYVFELSTEIHERANLASLSRLIQKSFLWLLGILSTVLLTAFAFQNIIASKADSLSLRAIRFTAGELIPIVGSAISESSKTLISGMELIRSSAGGVVIAVLLLYFIPPLFTLLISKFLFSLSGTFASILENSVFEGIFSACASAVKSMIALVAITDLTAVVAFALAISV